MANSFHWTCPYCDRDTTITDTQQTAEFRLSRENNDGYRRFWVSIIVCPNPKCQRFVLNLLMYKSEIIRAGGTVTWKDGALLQQWRLIPPSLAKVFPEYVPAPIREDYTEACLIRDLSAKASATLSRRCLQGMIRDFWGISKPRLVDEVDALKSRTDTLTWEAIDAVRKIGNIGAHMEKDINVIVDVEPDEAQKLIELIELLVEDWYVARHQREERLKSIIDVQQAKDAVKSGTVARTNTSAK